MKLSSPLRRPSNAMSLVELLITMAILSTLMGALLPAVNAAREAARRMQCTNNLRQLGIATNAYEAARGHLPPPKLGTQFENRGSTLVLLLPYLEEHDAYARYRFDEPIDSTNNRPITARPVSVYLCPTMRLPATPLGDTSLAPGSYVISSRTTYAKHQQLDGAFANQRPGQPYRLSTRHIRDGASRTLLFGEINYGHADFRWSEPSELAGQSRWGDTTWANGYWFHAWGHMSDDYPHLFNNSQLFLSPYSPRAFRSDHPGGVQFVKIDGSALFLTNDTDPQVRRAYVTRRGRD